MHLDDRQLILLRNKMGENLPVPPKRKKRDNEESRSQIAVINWWHHACRGFKLPETVLFSIPNGGFRSVVTASILKREGLRSGVSDLFLTAPRGYLHGCYVEMKQTKGVVSEAQRDFISVVGALGYATNVCHSTDEAIAVITRYLNEGLS